MLEAIRGRFADCGLELHPEKTWIVYCKDDDRPARSERLRSSWITSFARVPPRRRPPGGSVGFGSLAFSMPLGLTFALTSGRLAKLS